MPGSDIDYLYETPETGELRISPEGKALRVSTTEQSGRQSSIPDASFSGPSRPVIGMGGSVAPSVPDRVRGQGIYPGLQKAVQTPRRERALTPEEMMALANAMQRELETQMGKPYEPAVHPDMNVPYWLQSYAKKEGLTK